MGVRTAPRPVGRVVAAEGLGRRRRAAPERRRALRSLAAGPLRLEVARQVLHLLRGAEPVVDLPGGAALLLRGPGSASRTPAIHSSLPSSAGPPLPWGIGAAGDTSSMSAYFATVFRLARGTRAASDLERPAASIDRISFTVPRGAVISSILPGRARQSDRPGKSYGEGRAPRSPGRGPLA